MGSADKMSIELIGMSVEILGCSCGGDGQLYKSMRAGLVRHFVECDKCGVRGIFKREQPLAIRCWNLRIKKRKVCIDCKEEKDVSDFHRLKNGYLGVQGRCKPCSITNRQKWRDEHPESVASVLACDPQYYKKYRWKRILDRYGLTKDGYEKILSDQGGKCAICKKDGKLVVDHCHRTMVVRGLLCTTCNTGLRFIETYVGWIDSATVYLSRGSV